ncbi:MAG: NAD(P)-binding protein [Pseudomonadota bacterium]|nr:NAD(P)-binding protein [Pseudomonadota bacterium]
MKKKKIAVVGSGISGLSCAWKLSEKFNVELFECDKRFGGHSNTVKINEGEKTISVDTGFIVFNTHNYPLLCKFFDILGVKSYESDMSFSVSIEYNNLQYSGTNIFSIFAQPKNIFNLNFLRMLFEIIRFNRNVEKDKKNFSNLTIDQYLKKKKYSNYFIYNHLYPMAGSIWSSKLGDIKNYPFEKFVSFFANHGLLKIFNRPKWRTVRNGSRSYVDKILKNKKIKFHKNALVKLKKKNKMIFLNVNGSIKKYHHLVIATHSDQVKSVLNLNDMEKKIFSKIIYKKNVVYLHSDRSLMPKNVRVWSSWNYLQNSKKVNELTVTYWMNKLQQLESDTNFFVSLNPYKKPKKEKTFKVIKYEHPNYNFETFRKQKEIDNIQGRENVWFCGAYLGYGFHEDGISSSMHVAKRIYEFEKKKFNAL